MPPDAAPSDLQSAALAGALDPAQGLASSIGMDGLLLACMVLAFIALSAVVGTISSRSKSRSASREARMRQQAFRDLMRTVRMAESIVGVGIWQYDCESGTQDWSDGLKRLFGVEAEAEMGEGDAEVLLYANDTDLVGMVRQREQEIAPYSFEFGIEGYDGARRQMLVRACNLRGRGGSVKRVVAVIEDVSEQPSCNGECGSKIILSGVGSMVPIAIERQPAEQGDQRQYDPLTKLLDRRHLMRELDQMVATALKSNQPLALAMFDIDHWSNVDERLGQAGAKRVLKEVAQIASEVARPSDVVGRVGGDDFAWIIPGAIESTARILGEKLRTAIARRGGNAAQAQVTISLGISMVQAGDSALSLFARADRAHCEAKDMGRNRVRVSA